MFLFLIRSAEAKMFSLERFVTEKLPPGDTVPMSDIDSVKKAWKTQIETVTFYFGGSGGSCLLIKTFYVTRVTRRT
jgi:hypothetical protein